MNTTTTAIEVTNLAKAYKDVAVLDDVSFTVERGTVFALLGANGSGKTTTINILTTLIAADGGTASVAGFDVVTQAPKVREHISVTGQFAAVDDVLTAVENLVLIGRLRHVADPRRTAAALIDTFDLSDAADRRVQHVLRRDAPPAGHRHEPHRRRTGHLLRRADDRARPQEPHRHVGDHPSARRPGHHDLPDDPVPRRSRPARRRHRHPPRRTDRRPRHPRRAQGRRAHRVRRTRALFIEAFHPGLAVYNLPSVKRVIGPLDVDAMTTALNTVVRRHEPLRTNFELFDGEWAQVVVPPTPVSLPVDDLRDVPADRRDEVAAAAVAAEVRRPFDLRSDLKLRARLLRTDDEIHVLVVTVHHIAADGSSMVTMSTEVAACYEAAVLGTEPQVAPLPVRYTDVSVWQSEQLATGELATQLDRWRQRLAGPLPVLELPTDRPRPPTFASEAGSVDVELTGALATEVRAAARRAGVTPFMFLLGSYAATLARWTGADDLVIGTATANRRPETAHLVGLFASTVPLRLRIDRHAPLRDLLHEVRRVTMAAFADQDVPFDRIVQAVNPTRDLSRSPIFQTMFVLNNMTPAVNRPVAGIVVEDVAVSAAAVEVDVSVVLDESSNGFVGRVDFSAALFDAATVERFVQSWRELLVGAVCGDQVAIATLPVVPVADRALLTTAWNDTTTALPPYARADAWFAAQAAATPDSVAVTDGTTTLTYGELDEASNRVANHLASLGVVPGTFVGIAVQRSAAMVVVVLGVLKAGAAYVPLDPAFPDERLAFMVADSGVTLIVTSGEGVAARFAGSGPHGSVRTVDLVADGAALAAAAGGAPPAVPGDDAVAYVIYTSGSTGMPKGVVVGQRGLVNFLGSMQANPGMVADDVLVAVTTLSFDISVLELLLPLVTGASVVVATPEEAMDGRLLAALIERSGATVVQATPTTWSMLFELGWDGHAGLTALCGGEAMSPTLASRLVASCGRVWNMFGPTETTIWSTVFLVGPAATGATAAVPIGRPIGNSVCRVLDAESQLVPIGVPGELFIGGLGLAHGYLHRPELTAERFVADPFGPGRLYRTGDVVRWRRDGVLEFLGRVDHQVKVRGYRIELGEVEAVLRSHPAVVEAVVVADGSESTSRLVGYVTAGEGGVTADELRALARDRLPGYMVPSTFVTLDAFPTTPNRKIDRHALPSAEGVDGSAKARLDAVGRPLPQRGLGEHAEARDAVEERLTRSVRHGARSPGRRAARQLLRPRWLLAARRPPVRLDRAGDRSADPGRHAVRGADRRDAG